MCNIHVVCMLATFTTYESFLNKTKASYGVMCGSLIELPFEKVVIVTNIIFKSFL